jgi:hypothetical protein
MQAFAQEEAESPMCAQDRISAHRFQHRDPGPQAYVSKRRNEALAQVLFIWQQFVERSVHAASV